MLRSEVRNAHFDKLFNTTGLMWLGQNTNHFEPHPDVLGAMIQTIEKREFQAYAPPMGLEELRELIALDLGLKGQSVFITDGAVEALYNICRNLCSPGDGFVTTDPGWQWPKKFAEASGAIVTELPIYDASQNYKLTPAQLAAAVNEKTKIIYLVDPNNPLGVTYSRSEIEAFTTIAKRVGAVFVQDCTYRHFASDHTLAATVYPEKTITVYSFSKWLGLAGMRLGALIADRALVEKLVAAPPNNLGCNVVAQRAAIAGLRAKNEWFPNINARQRLNQSAIKEAAAKIKGMHIPVFPSQANFLVLECIDAGIKPEALCFAYRDEGIMIRQGTYHTAKFGHRFVKVSTTVPESWVEAFCEKLPHMVERARGLNHLPELF